MGRPNRPDDTTSRRATNTGDVRRTRPTWAGTPAAAAACVRASASARVGARGFSQKIATPRCAAAHTNALWLLVGVQTQTASTPSSNASASDATSARWARANASARAASMS